MKAFGTFKGGGVKGLAHVGAYKAAHDKGIEFIGVAGTSAGSIVAALIAIGYTPDELYNASADNEAQLGPFGEPYTQFFDMPLWDCVKSCGKALGSIGHNLSFSNGITHPPATHDMTIAHASVPKKRWFASGHRKPDAKKAATRNPASAYISTAILALRLLSPYLTSAYNRVRMWGCFAYFILAVIWILLFFCSNLGGRGLLVLLLLGCFLVHWKIKKTIINSVKQHDGLITNLPKVLVPLIQNRGLFPTEAFAVWLDKLLKAKISNGSGENGSVLFKDIQDKMPLKIVAANVTSQKVEVFSQEDTPDASIIDAVAASISIPMAFQPKSYHNMEYVDGGLVSNIPAWALDDERARAGIQTPTLVFKLEERRNLPPISVNGVQANPFDVLVRFLKKLLITLFEGGENLQYRQVGNLHIIPLKVDVSTLDIELSDSQRRALYDAGFRQTNIYLEQIVGPRKQQDMEEAILPGIKENFLNAIGKPEGHLRVAVLLRICKNSSAEVTRRHYLLRVCYSFNMKEDADDQLELDSHTGGAGLCWRERKEVFVNMEQAQDNYQSVYSMTKYQQALVRRSLKGLLCLPIWAEEQEDTFNVQSENSEPLLGILCFDTDDIEIQNIFENICSTHISDPNLKKFQKKARECAILVSGYLNP